MVSEVIDCNVTGAPLEWGSLNICGDLPLSIILIFAVSVGWGLLFLITFHRRLKHANSATNNIVVSKKMQHLQTWCFSYFHTMVYICTIFGVASLFLEGEPIPAAAILACLGCSTLFTSQVDVLGSLSKKPGTNNVDFSVAGQYLLTTYLPKAVWKQSGHVEMDEAGKKGSQTGFSSVCCMGDLSNHITPKVYDVKDVVGFQGAFVGLPALFVYLLTIVRSNGMAAGEDYAVGNLTLDTDLSDIFELDLLMIVSAVLSFLSAIVPPILGDWETHGKNIVYSLGSVVLRSLEVVGRVCFYIYFIDFSKFIGFLLLGAEFALMFFTNITARETSAAGRTGSVSHFALSSWEAVCFTNYRRISVDKEFVTHNTMMPVTIECIRFLGRTAGTIIGYVIMAAGDLPTSYTEVVESVTTMPVLFFVGVAANILVIILNLIYFLCIKRSKMCKSDLGRLWSYWKSLPPCSCLCPSTVVHVNREQNMGGINYV